MASESLNDLDMKRIATFLRALEGATGEEDVRIAGNFEITVQPNDHDVPLIVVAGYDEDRGEYLFHGWPA